MKPKIFFIIVAFFLSCNSKVEKVKPVKESISESIYASGTIKSKNQYQVFSIVNGIIEEVFVSEGDTIKKGTPLLTISNEAQRLNKENAELAANYADINANQGKLNEADMQIALSKSKMQNDSVLLFRQRILFQKQIGTKVELEQRELAYENSKTNYYSAKVRYNDLKRQLDLNSAQSKKNLLISGKLERDYTITSEIDGIVYSLNKSKGELVGAQTPLAVIGDASGFVLEMQVDEYDILKIKKGLNILVTLDSYKGKVFEATVTKINPLMNERSKTFLVEATFVVQPEILYPNITFEANIVLHSKPEAILIPRNYLVNDSTVIKSNGDKITVKTGLKDYQKVEIISGLTLDDELQKPKQ